MIDAPENITTLRRAYTFRLVPTPEQAAAMKHTLDACRHVYNAAVQQRYAYLDQKRISYDGHWQRLGWYEQKREIKDFRPAPELAEMGLTTVYSWVFQDVLQRVDRAFARWLAPDATGRRFGRPRYQGWKHYNSWTYSIAAGGARLRDPDPFAGAPLSARLHIQPSQRGPDLDLFSIGRVAVRWHHQQAADKHAHVMRGTIKTVTIKREADGWYAVFSCADIPRPAPLPATGQTTALDVRVSSFATLADGTEIGNPRYYQAALRELRIAQRRLDRRKPKPGQKASKGYEKARALLAKAHQRVARQRHGFHHATARDLLTRYDAIAREDLDIKTLLEVRAEEEGGAGEPQQVPAAVRVAKNRGMSDSGWGNFFAILDAKAEETGRVIHPVNPAYTTRTCSVCGHVEPQAVRGRVYACPVCGNRMGKAHNAARNVLRAATFADSPTADGREDAREGIIGDRA